MYFNHAFNKLFLGTHATQADDATHAGVDEGFLTTDLIPSASFIDTTTTVAKPYGLGVGVFGFLNPATYLSENNASAVLTAGKPLILASSALYTNDKIGPFHGGYQETTKSKLINPKYVSRFYRVDPCLPNNNIIHVGATPYTTGLSPADATCCHDFCCNKTYYLRLDVKGSPSLRYLTRNAYYTADAYTGCCPGTGCDPTVDTDVTTDPTLVMIQWANGLLGQGTLGAANYIPNVITGPFISIVVYDYAGNAWFQPGTNAGVDEWDTYVSVWDPATNTCAAGDAAGLVITGAYVDTVFGDCSFYPSDFFQKEPVHLYASEVDLNGDTCAYSGLCVIEECCPRQGMGFGEQVLRDLILSESYMQNYFATNMDIRIREITQGNDITSAITRSAQYYRYNILHSVPRFNNPTGVFDNDQYLLTIITEAVSASFETAMATWLAACGCNAELETFVCGAACP